MNKFLAPALASFCIGGIIFLQFLKLKNVEEQGSQIQPKSVYLLESEQEEANLELMKQLPTFGFDNVIADWAFLRFLQYFGNRDARQNIGYGLSSDYFEIFVDLNPQFTEPYTFMSPATSLYAARPDQSVELIEKGLKSISPRTSPDAYKLWISKASDELLFLGDNQAATQSYLQAAKWTKDNPDPEAQRIGAIVTKTAQFLTQNPDSKNARIGAWLMILRNAIDDETRQRSMTEIQTLGGQVTITEQNEIKVQVPKRD